MRKERQAGWGFRAAMRWHVLAAALTGAMGLAAESRGQCPMFTIGLDVSIGPDPLIVALVDLNGDGKLDMIAAGYHGVTARLGAGDGTFGAQMSVLFAMTPSGMVLGDFNRDGKLDVVISSESSASLLILLGDGAGGFGAATRVLPAPSSGMKAVVAGDFNEDGRLDLAVAASTSSSVLVLLGDGQGSFIQSSVLTLPAPATSLAAADLNRDGRLDVIAACPGFLATTLGNGDGSFAPATLSTSLPGTVRMVAGDVDGDGRIDCVVGSQSGGRVFLGTGNGTFAAGATLSIGAFNEFKLVDINGDGRVDLLGTFGFMLGTGTGTFGATSALAAGYGSAHGLAVGDINNDGKFDVVGLNGTALVRLGGGASSYVTVSSQPSNRRVRAGQSSGFTVFVQSNAGLGTLMYQWRMNGAALTNGPLPSGAVVSGATTPIMLLGSCTLAENGAVFDCAISNACGTERTRTAVLLVDKRCEADFNGVNGLEIQDVYDFLSAWLAGCP